MVNKGTETQQKTVPDNLPSILHGALVGAGSLSPPKGGLDSARYCVVYGWNGRIGHQGPPSKLKKPITTAEPYIYLDPLLELATNIRAIM
jgi:hypothetical protein